MIKTPALLAFCFFCATQLFSSPDSGIVENDTLFSLIKQKNNNTMYLIEGAEVKLWIGRETLKGKLVEASDTLAVLVEGRVYKIDRNNLHKIKRFNEPLTYSIGTTSKVLGFATWGIGTIALAAGIAALTINDLGAIILIAVPPLGAGGYGLYVLGDRVQGKKFNLKKRWRLEAY